MQHNYSGTSISYSRNLTALAVIALLSANADNSYAAGGSGWSGAVQISPALQPDPTRGSQLNDIAVNTQGLTIAAWDQYSYNNGGGATIGAAVQSTGRWNAPFTISSSGGFATTPRVAVGDDGSMAVSWTYQDPATGPWTYQDPVTGNYIQGQKIQVAVKPANASVWTTTDLAVGPVGGVAITQAVPLGVDTNGNVTAVWSLWDKNLQRHIVQASTRAVTGSWSSPVNITSAIDGIFPSLAVNANGDAGIAFAVSPYTSSTGSCAPSQSGTCALYAFRSSTNGAWSTPSPVSETMSSSVGYISSPLVALDANGLATVIYLGYGIEATRQLQGGWQNPQTVISAPNLTSSYQGYDLGMDRNGNAVVAASIFDASIGVDRASIYAAQGNALGSWTAQQRLTDPSVPVDAYAARVALSPDGAMALVGWIDHYHGVAQLAQLAGNNWTTTTIGRGTAYSSFQEVLSLDAASGPVARAIWKSSKNGTKIMAVGYR